MPQPLSLQEQIARKCIHFNGVMEKVCKAGIKYEDVREEPQNGPYRFPCLKQGGECPQSKFLNEEQVNEKVTEIEHSCTQTIIAISKVKEHIHLTKEQHGKIKCECGGDLHYTVAQVNGHVWAKCNSCEISFNE
jgi:hypothetical protein